MRLAMWPYYQELLRRPVPRYTSYPTAAEFTGEVGVSDHAAALARVAPGADISIYVHIPFCDQICWYCGCNTARSNKAARLSTYLDALRAEISLVAAKLPEAVKVRRLSFGGGSPNALSAVDFVRILDDLTINIGAPDPKISVELDPRNLSLEWLRTIASVGITNISLGVQTFDPLVQKSIGRVQPHEQVIDIVKELRMAGVASINFDLMYGLPYQDDWILRDTLEKTIDLKPDRIALFGYAHLPAIIGRQKRIPEAALPRINARFQQSQLGYKMLCQAGYEPIGFDHFALPSDPLAIAARAGQLHRNFQGFTDDSAGILVGLGSSAISNLPGLLVQNRKNHGEYATLIKSGSLATERGVMVTAADVVRSQIIEQILCSGRVTLPRTILAEQSACLEEFERKGLLTMSGNEMRLSEDGLPYARVVASTFDDYRSATSGTFSQAV